MDRSDLPEVIQDLLNQQPEELIARRKAFGEAMARKRDEAVKYRASTGIEAIWLECEEAYLGIDDLNRGEFSGQRWAKPMTMEGPLRKEVARTDPTKSTAFVRLTSRYVDAGSAKIAEIALSVDDKSFGFEPTPVPDLIADKDDERQVTVGGGQVMRPKTPEEMAPPVQPGAAPAMPGQPPQPMPGAPIEQTHVPLTVADLAKIELEKAAAKAKKAEDRIYDWMVECGHKAEMRKVLFDAARLGVGVLKGPFPKHTRGIAYTVGKDGQGGTMQIVEKITPADKWIDPWNFYPSGNCGEDIHSGDITAELDFISASKLKALAKVPGYDPLAIAKVIEEGPSKCLTVEHRHKFDQNKVNKDRYEIWYCYGEITVDELHDTNPDEAETLDPEQDSVFAIITLVNDTAIRVAINPLESGSFPYHTFSWRRRAGSWAGVGVAEQVKTAQQIVNGAERAMLTNAGLSSGSQFVVNRGAIQPADGNWTMTPRKFWYTTDEGLATGVDIRTAFGLFDVPNKTPELLTLIEHGFKIAEESSNIPLISQGQSGANDPQTFGGQQLQNNNANQLLRDVGYGLADSITDPLVRQYYEWLLLDPDVPDDEKGDYQINTNAAAVMIERAIQDMSLPQLVANSVNPAFGIDPKKAAEQWIRSLHFDPAEFMLSEEDQKKLESQPPPEAPAVTAAKIRAEVAAKIAEGQQQASVQKMTIDRDRDTAYVTAHNEGTQLEHQARMQELALKEKLGQNQQGIEIEKLKTELASLTMKLRVQQELSQASLGADLHKHATPQAITPPTEPEGRAPTGQSFAK